MVAEKKEETALLVVDELPKLPTRVVVGEDGKRYDLLTRDEALLEILETVRVLKKGITG